MLAKSNINIFIIFCKQSKKSYSSKFNLLIIFDLNYIYSYYKAVELACFHEDYLKEVLDQILFRTF